VRAGGAYDPLIATVRHCLDMFFSHRI